MIELFVTWILIAATGGLFALMPWAEELHKAEGGPVPYNWRTHMLSFGFVLLWPAVAVVVPIVVMVTALCMAIAQTPKSIRALINWSLRLTAGGER